ncbi:SDR family NAD(P)-dependent oxidoreductase [Oricola sp.]|uniref:SDR family NAD(P)-dependent oxidoreductase n=1 Tax=Oricola sp. TaxID=1979950 RepID=UPI0025D47D51|nr:SDR family NAD(P)-dependent oxidoreductase [Oricola sp.]MCI5074110.1 SDR family NAD(P)-dependent oxidoreductase [Oricola sp.]
MSTVLITGADTDQGLAHARAFAAADWRILAAGTRPLDDAARASLGAALAVEWPYDPLKDGAAEDLAHHLGAEALDAVVFASETREGIDLPAEELTRDLLVEAMLVNTYAPLHLAACLQPSLAAGEAPAIVALVGNAGVTGSSVMPHGFPLKTSKAALRQMWRNLAVEWRDWGCRCVVSVSGAQTGCHDPVDRVLAAIADPQTPHYCEV